MDQNTIRQTSRRQAGQGMTEYIIMVALIAIAAIGVYGLFGDTLRSQVGGMAQSLSGQDASGSISAAQESANSASEEAQQDRGLGNYAPAQ